MKVDKKLYVNRLKTANKSQMTGEKKMGTPCNERLKY